MRLIKSIFGLGIMLFSAIAFAQTWQQAVSPNVLLEIRDKHGEKGAYVAQFVVVCPDGKTISTQVDVKQDDWGRVLFPESFSTYWVPGKYRWKAIVDGKPVIYGEFKYKVDKKGSTVFATH